MVYVAAAVEFYEWDERHLFGQGGFAVCGGGLLEGGELFGEVVEACYVGLVVLFMVDFHDFAVDGGFEGIVGVCMIVVSYDVLCFERDHLIATK